MGRSFAVITLALVGLLCAAGMGYGAYVVSRGSVAVPVTRLQQSTPVELTPSRVREHAAPKPKPKPTTRATTTVTRPSTTTDDHGRRGRGGSGGGGHGSDD